MAQKEWMDLVPITWEKVGPQQNMLWTARSLDSGELQTSLLSLGHNAEFRRECPWCRGPQWRSVALKLGAEAPLDEAKVLVISIS